jgi:hypothetical protein
MAPMQAEDQLAEWLVRWEEAVLANRPPPALDVLPPELRPRAREGLRVIRGFARMSHGLSTTAPAPPGDAPQHPRTRHATVSRGSWPAAAWPRCGAAAPRCWRAKWP